MRHNQRVLGIYRGLVIVADNTFTLRFQGTGIRVGNGYLFI
jgi:hypothetical protein